MKEICLVNKGDNIKKLVMSMGISEKSKIEDDKILDYKYIELEKGEEDIICVRNYFPYYIKKIDENNTLLDIYAMGYEVLGNNNAGINDSVVIRKISGIRYIVRPMEKLDDIANKLGVDKETIIEKNNLLTDKLFVGQILIV